MGFNRAGEVYDPLIHGETVGQVIGPATFLPGRGIQLDTGTSYVKYLLAQTITNGEFSMDVEGLRGNGPGDKAKVFGMQEGQDDFITNRYRVDIQYRGVGGFPPNAITFRALYGSGEDLKVRYEPDTTTRLNSTFALNPSTTYHWKAVWGSEFRLVVPRAVPRVRALQRRDGVAERRLRARIRTTPIWALQLAEAATSRRRLPARSIGTCGLRIVPGPRHWAARYAEAVVSAEFRVV